MLPHTRIPDFPSSRLETPRSPFAEDTVPVQPALDYENASPRQFDELLISPAYVPVQGMPFPFAAHRSGC